MLSMFRKFSAASLAVTTLLAAVTASAATFTVSVDGADSGTCGADEPCATIAQAVTNAADGDTISVLPGSYAGATIDKSVSLYSSSGTFGAVITSTLAVAANGVVVGKTGKGFAFFDSTTALSIAGDEVTVRGNAFSGSSSTCVEVTSGSAAVIRDNTFNNCTNGISVISATSTEIRSNRFGYSATTGVAMGAASSGAVVRENRTFGPSGSGFVISGSDHLFFRNLVHGSPAGGFVTTGVPTNVELRENLVVRSSSPGFYLSSGTGWVLDRNAAVNNNAPGFLLSVATPVLMTGNVAVGGMSSAGIQINGGSDHVLIANSAIGNAGDGLLLSSVGTGVTVTGGNLYGNGNGNCGLSNSSASAVTTTGIYWGDPNGPGADPADLVCANVAAVVVNDPAAARAKLKMPGIK
jgi:nitrous oxidase accessory protein NosD